MIFLIIHMMMWKMEGHISCSLPFQKSGRLVMKGTRIKIIYIILVSILLLVTAHAEAFKNSEKKTIGIIMIPNIHYYEEIHRAFIGNLFSGGIIRDQVEIIVQKPLPDRISLLNTVRKFAALDVDVIVSYGAPATLAAVSEQTNIPVVFAGVFDPYGVGISMKNATGVSSKVSILNLLQRLKKISNFSRLGVLYTSSEQDTLLQLDEVEKLEEKLNFKSVAFNIRRTSDTLKIKDVDALLITTSCPVLYCLNDIINIARRKRIPTASLISTEKGSGVLLTISANPDEQGREAARLAIKLLRGEKASSLPVVTPGKIDVITNIKEASNLGFDINLKLITDSKKAIN
jgi:putative ABC transport system substrate-binding protein